jgi:hypothetical protein
MRALILLVLLAVPAHAYPVGPPIPLEKLAAQVDLVCKATVISVRRVTDPSFVQVTSYPVHEAELRVVSTFKGKPGKTIRFRYYSYLPAPNTGIGYSPLAYELTPKVTYLLFAAGKGNAYRQFQKDHTQKEQQGVILAADDKPHQGTTITDVAFHELRNLLASGDPEDVNEAIEELDLMSGGRLSKLADFDRRAVLAAVRPLIMAKSDEVAKAAITMFGSDGPYFVDRDAPYWLAGVGKGTISGLSPRKPNPDPASTLATAELMEVANNRPTLKALAIRALGRSQGVPAPTLAAWGRDPDVEVRRAAILISAESRDRSLIKAGAVDKHAAVRATAALAIGFAQEAGLLPLLDKLMKDAESKVRTAAAMSLLSFSIDKAAATMKANFSTDYKPLFVNQLAKQDPAPYLADLAEVIEKQLQPAGWWGGSIPSGDSWKLLFGYLKKRPDLATGKYDRWFDALEKMKWHGSSDPTALYALYVHTKLVTRATAFRTLLKTQVSYSMDSYLDAADKNPTHYLH